MTVSPNNEVLRRPLVGDDPNVDVALEVDEQRFYWMFLWRVTSAI